MYLVRVSTNICHLEIFISTWIQSMYVRENALRYFVRLYVLSLNDPKVDFAFDLFGARTEVMALYHNLKS